MGETGSITRGWNLYVSTVFPQKVNSSNGQYSTVADYKGALGRGGGGGGGVVYVTNR